MKKTFLLAFFLIMISTQIKAQEVYDYLLDKSELVINNTQSNAFDRKVAEFKIAAMSYFRKNIILRDGAVSSTWLDEQALALNEFVTNYLMELSQNSGAKENDRKKIIMRYCLASNKFPLFKKVNKKEADAFLRDKEGYTPFTLNTDWMKALEETKKKDN